MRFTDGLRWDTYALAEYSFLARRRSDGLYPIQALVALRSRPSVSDWQFHSESRDLVVARGIVSVADLRAALAEAAPEMLQLEQHCLVLRRVEEGQPGSWSCFNGHDWGARRIGWPSRVLRVGLSGIPEVMAPLEWNAIDEQFGALEPVPFPSLEGTVRWLSRALDLAGHSCLDIYAPIYARLGDSSLDLATGHAAVVVESLVAPAESSLQVAFVPHRSLAPPIVVPSTSWESLGHDTWRAHAQLPIGAGWVDVRLVARGTNIFATTIHSPSLPVAAHTLLSGGPTWLGRLLASDSSSKHRATDFERGVVALLALGRIPAVPYGHDGLDRFMDVVAFPSEDRVIVGECTVDMPSPDKMTKLRGRAESVAAQLATAGRTPLVVSVVFLPSSVKAMPEELQRKAAELGVSLIWGERLQHLLTLIEAGESPQRVFDALRHS